MPDAGSDMIRHALSVARRHGFGEVVVETPTASFEAKLEAIAYRTPRPWTEPEELKLPSAPPVAEISATLVGYYQPSDPPIAAGGHVKSGEIIAVITALGLANDVESQVSGEVLEVLVKDGQAVEFGQPIARVKVEA